MLPKKFRLKKKKVFESVFKKGKVIKGQSVFLNIKKNNLTYSRFGFVVGKKTAKKAVVRNKIKRRLRGIIKREILNIKDGFDVVIVTNPKIVEKEYQEIREELKDVLKKGKLLK